jgi:hypothetical protein
MANFQNPKRPMYAKKEPETIPALGPAERVVNKTIRVKITIQGVCKNNNSKKSKTVLMPKLIPSKKESPFRTAVLNAVSIQLIETNLILGCVGKLFKNLSASGKL